MLGPWHFLADNIFTRKSREPGTRTQVLEPSSHLYSPRPSPGFPTTSGKLLIKGLTLTESWIKVPSLISQWARDMVPWGPSSSEASFSLRNYQLFLSKVYPVKRDRRRANQLPFCMLSGSEGNTGPFSLEREGKHPLKSNSETCCSLSLRATQSGH